MDRGLMEQLASNDDQHTLDMVTFTGAWAGNALGTALRRPRNKAATAKAKPAAKPAEAPVNRALLQLVEPRARPRRRKRALTESNDVDKRRSNPMRKEKAASEDSSRW
uniref:Uncharacterized protein n=1 Tax=Mycena chlorophos TaxID=658473 RepID=A0ABQ0KU24_MYCCL|nr:predicted protein [Mycena chlorophos]